MLTQWENFLSPSNVQKKTIYKLLLQTFRLSDRCIEKLMKQQTLGKIDNEIQLLDIKHFLCMISISCYWFLCFHNKFSYFLEKKKKRSSCCTFNIH